MARSNSAKTPIIWNIAFPAGVVVSRPCWCRNRSIRMAAHAVRAGLARARSEGKELGRPPIAPELEGRIREALNKPGRTEGVRKIAERFGVAVGTVQRISRPFAVDVASAVA